MWVSPGELQISVDKARLVLRLTAVKEECGSALVENKGSGNFKH